MVNGVLLEVRKVGLGWWAEVTKIVCVGRRKMSKFLGCCSVAKRSQVEF
jgi:hypothetical protein